MNHSFVLKIQDKDHQCIDSIWLEMERSRDFHSSINHLAIMIKVANVSVRLNKPKRPGVDKEGTHTTPCLKRPSGLIQMKLDGGSPDACSTANWVCHHLAKKKTKKKNWKME